MSNLEGRALDEAIKSQLRELRALRPLDVSNREAKMPISFGICHQPIDPMGFVLGEWVETPWEGVTCLGLSLSEHEVVVLCQVEKPVHMEKQEHGPWAESLVMAKGVLHEHTTGDTYLPGAGLYEQKAGQIHEPEFKTPSRCLITWTR